MNKVVKALITGFIIFISSDSFAQQSFFSKLYFPSEFGINYPINNHHLKNGVLITSGIEYRFNVDKGIFLRFNYDNLSNRYEIEENTLTNVQKSRLKSDLILLGMGYRLGKSKLKYRGFIQLGMNQSQFPILHSTGPGLYEVNFSSVYSLALKVAVGAEYDITDEFVISLEPQYIYMHGENIFWNESSHTLGIKIGFSALLF